MFMSQRAYIKNKGEVCPNSECSDPNPDGSVEYLDFPDWEGTLVTTRNKCTHCGIEWREELEFRRYIITNSSK